VEQELLALPEHLSSPHVFSWVCVVQSIVFSVVFCGSLFVCLWFTVADYTFGILSLIYSCWLHLWYLVSDLQLLITPLVSCLWFTVADCTFGILSLIYSCWLHLWYLVFDLQLLITPLVSCLWFTLLITPLVSCLWFTVVDYTFGILSLIYTVDYTFGILSLIYSCWLHLWYLVSDLQLLITPLVSCLWFTVADYTFGIFILFLNCLILGVFDTMWRLIHVKSQNRN
jgi:hypothetical protein